MHGKTIPKVVVSPKMRIRVRIVAFFGRPIGPVKVGNGRTKTTRFLESNLTPDVGEIATVAVVRCSWP